MPRVRAVSEEAKAQKSRLIVETAANLFVEEDFENIKMIQIAQAAGVSKGTLFNYYSCKEHLFACVLINETNKRFEKMKETLDLIDSFHSQSFKEFVLEEMESILIPDSALIRLKKIKMTILEHNLDNNTAAKVKKIMYDQRIEIINLIKEKAEFLSLDEIAEIIISQNAIIIGFANIAIPGPNIRYAIEVLELDCFKLDFKKNSLQVMEAYLDKILSK